VGNNHNTQVFDLKHAFRVYSYTLLNLILHTDAPLAMHVANLFERMNHCILILLSTEEIFLKSFTVVIEHMDKAFWTIKIWALFQIQLFKFIREQESMEFLPNQNLDVLFSFDRQFWISVWSSLRRRMMYECNAKYPTEV